MCLKCHLNLKLAFTIRQKMLKAEERFREHKCSIPVKEECADNELIKEENVESSYTCDICGKRKNSKANLNKHIKHHQSSNLGIELEEKENYDYCETERELEIDVKEHILQTPEVELKHKPASGGDYTCGICGIKKHSSSSLRSHKYNVHLKRECPICTKKVCRQSFKRHVKLHTVKKPVQDTEFTCDMCGKVKPSKALLTDHRNRAHQVVECPICNKKVKKSGLKCHMGRHDTSKEGEHTEYVCDICGKNKFSKGNLRQHKYNVHVELECPICRIKVPKPTTNVTSNVTLTPTLCANCVGSLSNSKIYANTWPTTTETAGVTSAIYATKFSKLSTISSYTRKNIQVQLHKPNTIEVTKS